MAKAIIARRAKRKTKPTAARTAPHSPKTPRYVMWGVKQSEQFSVGVDETLSMLEEFDCVTALSYGSQIAMAEAWHGRFSEILQRGGEYAAGAVAAIAAYIAVHCDGSTPVFGKWKPLPTSLDQYAEERRHDSEVMAAS